MSSNVYRVATAALLATVASTAGGQGAATGTLRLTPPLLRTGQPVEVDYTPSPSLVPKPQLALRAAVFGAAGAPRELNARTLVTLGKGKDGHFRGRFVAPSDASLLRMAVETSTGDAVDRNDGTYFDAVYAAPDGKPMYDGLWWSAVWARIRMSDVSAEGRQAPPSLFARIDSVSALYPARAGGWRLHFMAGPPLSPDQAAQRKAGKGERADRAAAIDATLSKSGTTDLAEATELANLSVDAGRMDLAQKWRDRIIADSMRSDAQSRNVWYLEAYRRASMALNKHEPAPQLERAVANWKTGANNTYNLRLSETGARMALIGGDTIKARTWYDRCGEPCTLAFPLAPKGAELKFMLGRSRQLIAKPIIGSARMLGVTLAEAAAVDTNVRVRLLTGYADLLTSDAQGAEATKVRALITKLAPDGAQAVPPAAGLVFVGRSHLAEVPRR